MEVEKSTEDSPSQRLGRALIIMGGLPLVFLIGNESERAVDRDDAPGWWRPNLAAVFDPNTFGLVSWVLLAIFGLGIALNLWGLWPELRGFRCSIRWVMGAVAVASVSCLMFRLFPKVGLVMILMAALSPASVLKSTRRRIPPSGVSARSPEPGLFRS
jgi:hypothetical protein